MKPLYALLTGLVFGVGIAISGMMNPAKVLNFFDLAGSWDPSLAFVMGGALIVAFIGYRLVWKRGTPVFAERFQISHRHRHRRASGRRLGTVRHRLGHCRLLPGCRHSRARHRPLGGRTVPGCGNRRDLAATAAAVPAPCTRHLIEGETR